RAVAGEEPEQGHGPAPDPHHGKGAGKAGERDRPAAAVPGVDRQPEREDSHLQLPAEPGDRPPHRPDLAPVGSGPGRRSGRNRGRVDRREQNSGVSGEMKVNTLRRQAWEALKAAGIADTVREADWRLAPALGLSLPKLLFEGNRAVAPLQAEQAWTFIRRRAAHEPLQYLLA